MNQRKLGQITLVALGSNEDSTWGDPRETLRKALDFLQNLSEAPLKISRLYTTPAFPKGTGPDFVNAAVALQSTMSPAEILAKLHEIEASAGRLRSVRWGQRTLDLDLIAVGASVLPSAEKYASWRDLPLEEQTTTAPDQLVLPHPRLQDRAFVLVPLVDVAPDWVHPVSGRTVVQMCAALPPAARADVVAIDPD